LPALFAALLAGCGRGVIDDAWRRLDLWELPGGVFSPVAERPLPLRDVLRTLQDRSLRVLNPQPGERLAWRLELLAAPRFEARPIAEGGPCAFTVTLRDAEGDDHLLLHHVGRPSGINPPPAITADLSPFAGQRVMLLLATADAAGPGEEPCRRASWGSPVVVHRGPAPGPRRRGPPNVILIGADTLRADVLGAYGRQPSITPAIDRLAAVSDVWLEAFASSNNTNPSFISLMTGLYAKNHGVYDLESRLPDSYLTLAELLRGAGYHTWGITAATHLGYSSGLRQGFDLFVGPNGQFFGETVVDVALGWLERPLARPFFLWLHFFDPHVPHNPPSPYHLGRRPADRFGLGPVAEWTPFRQLGGRDFDPRVKLPIQGHADLYLGEVAYLDRQIDRLLDFLESRRLLDNTILVFVADHGETLGERGNYFDHAGLFDITTHVPLFIHWPGQREGRRRPGLVQHLDLFPTLLRHAGVKPPPQDGRELPAAAAGERGRRLVFAQHALDNGAMVRGPRFKYAVNRESPLYPQGAYLFDLVADPGERRNLAGSGHPKEAELAAILERWLADRQPGDAPLPVELSDEERRRLEALGYGR